MERRSCASHASCLRDAEVLVTLESVVPSDGGQVTPALFESFKKEIAVLAASLGICTPRSRPPDRVAFGDGVIGEGAAAIGI